MATVAAGLAGEPWGWTKGGGVVVRGAPLSRRDVDEDTEAVKVGNALQVSHVEGGGLLPMLCFRERAGTAVVAVSTGEKPFTADRRRA